MFVFSVGHGFYRAGPRRPIGLGIGIGVGMAMRAERRAVRRAYRYNRRGYGGYGGYGASEHIRRGWIQPRRHSCGLAGVLLSPL